MEDHANLDDDSVELVYPYDKYLASKVLMSLHSVTITIGYINSQNNANIRWCLYIAYYELLNRTLFLQKMSPILGC